MTEVRDGSGAASAARSRTPCVWCLLGHRVGDNLQVEALADALAWPWEPKRLNWREEPVKWSPLYGRRATLVPVAPPARAQFRPPWPDLVLAIGWRSAPVAQWIRRQSGARLVHLGRPRAPLDRFDLVLTTPQYALPDAPNVVRLDGPLNRLSPDKLEPAAATWRPRLDHLPHPWIALLVGGSAPPIQLTPSAAAELGRESSALARRKGGSLLITTSARTSPTAIRAMLSQVDVPAHRYTWGEPGENPYFGYLALADEFVVTSESVSMVHEASLTGRPLHLFAPPSNPRATRRMRSWFETRAARRGGLVGRAHSALVGAGWINTVRAPDRFHDRLILSGRAVELGEERTWAAGAVPAQDLDRAVDAVRAIFSESRWEAFEGARTTTG